MEEMLGTVLSVLSRVPDELVDAEWQRFKLTQFGETLIPNRCKELIGNSAAMSMRISSRCTTSSALLACTVVIEPRWPVFMA